MRDAVEMGIYNSNCSTPHASHTISIFTQKCYVSPFAGANPMCVDPDPTKCVAATQLKTCDPGFYCAFRSAPPRSPRRPSRARALARTGTSRARAPPQART